MKERDLQRATARLIKSLGWLAWHTPNERKSKLKTIELKRQGVLAGVSDWIIAEHYEDGDRSGFGIAIELKTPKGRVSQTQRLFLEQLAARGCLTATCRSLDEFRDVLRKVRPRNGRRVA